MTATTADPITLLRGAPAPELARVFIAWLLTPEAQSLWQRARSGPEDGLPRPEHYELRRQPIRADLYRAESRAGWVDRSLDPFATAVPLPEGTPDYFAIVAPLSKAMAIDIHDDLRAAWQALVLAEQQKHPRWIEMNLLFYAMPEELTLVWPDLELQTRWQEFQRDPGHRRHVEVIEILSAFSDRLSHLGDMDARRVQWRAYFQANYREVVRLGGEAEGLDGE